MLNLQSPGVYVCAKIASSNPLKDIFNSQNAIAAKPLHMDPSSARLGQVLVQVVMTCPISAKQAESWTKNTNVFKKKTSEWSSDCWDGLQPALPRPPERLHCLTFGGNVSSKHVRWWINLWEKSDQIPDAGDAVGVQRWIPCFGFKVKHKQEVE